MNAGTQGGFEASLLQFDVRLGRPEENLGRALALLSSLPAKRPQLALLPEVFTTNFTFRDAQELCGFSKHALEELSGVAQEKGIAVAGSILEPASKAAAEEGFFANRAFFINEKGERLSNHAKRHLIRLGHEHLFYEPGPKEPPALLEWQGLKIAVAICYDIRFPEWIGRLAFAGAQVLVVPAQWPEARIEHWRALLKARAIENQFFVLGCNRIGNLDGMNFCGGSEIYDPWGERLAAAPDNAEAVASAWIDVGKIEEVRRRLPAFGERRREEQA